MRKEMKPAYVFLVLAFLGMLLAKADNLDNGIVAGTGSFAILCGILVGVWSINGLLEKLITLLDQKKENP